MQEAEAQLTNARLNRSNGAVRADTALHQAAAALTSAQLGARAAAAANDTRSAPPKVNELTAATAAVTNAASGVTSAQAAVTIAEHNLAKTELRAPDDGMIVTVARHVGELAAGSSGGGAEAAGGGAFITMITFEDR